MKPTSKQIKKAREVLENAGYFTRNLWSVEDVRNRMEDETISEEDALDILEATFDNEATYDQIWMSMDYAIENN